MKISGKRERVGIAMTAAHVVYNVPKATCGWCYLENGAQRETKFIKSFLQEDNQELISSLMNVPFCLPGDVALLLVILKPHDIVQTYALADSLIEIPTSCFVAGYPTKPRNVAYSLPQMLSESKEVIDRKANEIFCNFSRRVYAVGELESNNGELVEVSCSTTNGMSGGPIISNDMIVGLYVGGPPLPGQRELMILAKSVFVKQLRSEESLARLEKFRSSGLYSGDFFGFAIHLSKICTKNQTERLDYSDKEFLTNNNIHFTDFRFETEDRLVKMINESILSFNCKDDLRANVGISTINPIFNNVRNILNEFTSSTETFTDFEGLIDLLRRIT